MTKHIISNCITMLMLVIAAASCSDNSDYGKILRHLPEDSDFITVFNAEEIILSSGGTVENGDIKFSDKLSRLLGNEEIVNFGRTIAFLNNTGHPGINLKEMAVMHCYDHLVPTMVFCVDDMEKFKPLLVDYGFVETDSQDDITILSKRVYESQEGRNFDRFDYVALNGKCVYWKHNVCISQSAKPLRVLSDIIEGTHKSSFAKSPFAKYIKGNLGAISFNLPPQLRDTLRKSDLYTSALEPLLGCRVCVTGTIDNDEMTLTATCHDEKGKQLRIADYLNFIDPDASISSRPLTYLDKKQNLIYAFTLKNVDWNECFSRLNSGNMLTSSEKLIATITKSYLEQIDGTVAVGIGLTDGFNSLTRINSGDNLLKELNLTLVVETHKAESMVEDLKSLMTTGNIKFTDAGNGFTLTLPETNLQFTAKAADNILIISNGDIEKGANTIVKDFDFNDFNASAILAFPSTDALMKDLYIDNDVQISLSSDFDESQIVATLSVSGDNEGLISKLISIALSIESQEKALRERYTGRCKIE